MPERYTFENEKDGKYLHSDTEELAGGEFGLNGDEEYARVTTKDSKGRKAWTQPVWIWLF